MTTFFKGLLGIGSIILGGWTIQDAIRQNQYELDPVEVISDFDDEYYDIPTEQRFDPNGYNQRI